MDSNHFGHGFVDTALDVHGACTGGNVLQAFGYDGLGQYGSSGSTVTCVIASLACDFFYQLCARILVSIGQFHILGYGYAILCDVGSTEFLFDDYVTAFRAKGYFYGVCQSIDNPFSVGRGHQC